MENALIKSGLDRSHVERLVKKLACFREEDARVKALCEIPTPDWIAAKHVENVYSGDGNHFLGQRVVDNGVYIDPRCKAHEGELRAMNLLTIPVPRSSFWLHPGTKDADGAYYRATAPALWTPNLPDTFKVPRIYIREDLAGWYRADVELHERCHAWLDATTGTYVFHR